MWSEVGGPLYHGIGNSHFPLHDIIIESFISIGDMWYELRRRVGKETGKCLIRTLAVTIDQDIGIEILWGAWEMKRASTGVVELWLKKASFTEKIMS
jgi:hypothetical protein